MALIALPWISGSLSVPLLYLYLSPKAPSSGEIFIAAGAGGCIGYLTLALIAWCASQLGVSVFNAATAWFFAALLCCFLLLARLSGLGHPNVDSFTTAHNFANKPFVLFIIYSLTLGALALFQHLWLPILGWDVQDHWAPYSLGILQTMQSLDISPLQSTHRHPITTNLVIAWSLHWSSQTQQSIGIFLPWLLLFLSCYLTVLGYALVCTGSFRSAFLPVLMLTSIPLLENHAIIGGYSELFVAAIILSATAIVGVGLKLNRRSYVVMGILYGLLSIFIRNTGIVYALIPLVALGFTYAGARHSKLTKIMFFILLTLICILIDKFVFQVITSVSWPHYDPNAFQVTVFGYSLTFRDTSFTEIAQNLYRAYVYNQSFSLTFVTFLILAVLCRASNNKSTNFLIWSIALGVVAMALMQFTSYGFYHSEPTHDTALSRFSIPFATLVTLLISDMLGRVLSKNS